MHIISLRWRNGSSDFLHIVTNADGAKTQYRELKAADSAGLFDIAVFRADTFDEVKAYIEHETKTTKAHTR